MTEDKTPEVSLRAKYTLVDQEPPKLSHVVNFHRVGTDVVMSVGRFDVAELATKLAGREKKDAPPEEVELPVEVFSRFGMSPDAFARLFLNAQKVFDSMVKTGQIKAGEVKEGDHADTRRD